MKNTKKDDREGSIRRKKWNNIKSIHCEAGCFKALEKTFAPEFLNRIDEIINFNQLTRNDINQIINLELDKFKARCKGLGFELEVSDAAVDFLADKGFDKQYGARPLQRSIQTHLEDLIVEEMLSAGKMNREKVVVEVDKSGDKLRIK